MVQNQGSRVSDPAAKLGRHQHVCFPRVVLFSNRTRGIIDQQEDIFSGDRGVGVRLSRHQKGRRRERSHGWGPALVWAQADL